STSRRTANGRRTSTSFQASLPPAVNTNARSSLPAPVAKRWSRTSVGGSRRRRVSNPTGNRCARRIGAASSTSPVSGSRRRLLDEYERWTGDRKLVRDMEHEARAALTWIDEYADLQGNGYVSYKRRNEETGLENQCWKDSWDSISYRDGRLPGFPRATCELQG